MTDQTKTLIVGILDRSGSMQSIRTDMQGGFDHFIEEQRKLPGECLVSLYQFDDQYDVVYETMLINLVPPLQLVPRGNTALLDAVGKTVASVGEQLKALPEHHRPATVVILIITDGYENASKEYTAKQIREMVEHQQKSYNWQFVYLGAELSTIEDAQKLGIKTSARYSASGQGVRDMYSIASASVGNLRSAVARGDTDQKLEIEQDLTDKK